MKYAHINENNKLLGWYDKDIHDVIPTPNIAVSEEVWKNAISNNHNKVNQDGTTEYFDFRTKEEIEVQNLQQKIDEAKAYLASTDYKMTIDYFETMTSEQQEEITRLRAEAREFVRANEQS